MSIKKWLSILALSSAATLIPSKADAETVMQPIIFADPLEEVVPGRKVHANLFISAITMGENQLHFAVDGNECEIIPGSCNLRLALPPKTEVEEISQYGWRKEPGMIWGTNKEKILLYPNEKYQRAVRIIEILGKGAALQATGSMFAMKKTDDLVRIALTGKTKDEAYREKMRKAVYNMSLLAIPEHTPKNPLGPKKYFYSRGFDFKLSKDAKLAFGVLSLVVADKNHRTFAVSDLIVSFNDIPKRAVRPVVGRTVGGIEDLLLKNDPELRLLREYQEKNLFVVEYSFQTPLTPLDLYVMQLKQKGEGQEQVIKQVGKTFEKITERKYPRMMPHTGAALFSIETEDSLVFYLSSIPPTKIKAWREQRRKITPRELRPIRDKIKKIKKIAREHGKDYIEKERYLDKLTRR